MKKSEIKLIIDLDEQNIPETIHWDADDKDTPGPSPTKSFNLALWDHSTQSTLRIDLWTKDMPLEDMKKFYIDCIGGLGQSILNATGDEYMAKEMNDLCDKFVAHVKKELQEGK